MFIEARGSDRRGLKSIEDQISTDIHDIVQASKSDLMARGVAVDLLQTAKRVGPQCEAAEYEDLSGEKISPWTALLSMIVVAIKPNGDDIEELSMKAPMSVSKPAVSGRGSRTVCLRWMVIGGRGHDVCPGSGPLDGGNTLRPA